MSLLLGLLLIITAIFVEIAGFIIVGGLLGVMPTLLLLVVAMLAGIVLLRWQGKGLVQRITREIEKGQIPDRSLVEGMMMVFASILLIIPGFVGDIIGILLFVPPLRALLWRYMAKYVISSAKFYTRSGRVYTRSSSEQTFHSEIIDLESDDYHEQINEQSPWRQANDGKKHQ